MAEHQAFYNYWCTDSGGSDFDSKKFPRELQLRAKSPFYVDTKENQILITQSYETMFHHILNIHMQELQGRGVVLTRQPGISVSLQPDPRPMQQLISVLVVGI